MLSAELTDKQKEYRKFFKAKLRDFGVDSPTELSENKRASFFNEVRKEWKQSTPVAHQLIAIAEYLALAGKPEVKAVLEREL